MWLGFLVVPLLFQMQLMLLGGSCSFLSHAFDLDGPPGFIGGYTPAWPVGQRWVDQITEGSIPGREPNEMEYAMDLVGSKIQSLLSKEVRQEMELGEVFEVKACWMREFLKGYWRFGVGGKCWGLASFVNFLTILNIFSRGSCSHPQNVIAPEAREQMTETSGSLPSDFSVVMDLGSFYYLSSEVFQVTGQGETRTTSVGPLSPVSSVHLLFQDSCFRGPSTELESHRFPFGPKVIMPQSGVRVSISESWRAWQHSHK